MASVGQTNRQSPQDRQISLLSVNLSSVTAIACTGQTSAHARQVAKRRVTRTQREVITGAFPLTLIPLAYAKEDKAQNDFSQQQQHAADYHHHFLFAQAANGKQRHPHHAERPVQHIELAKL